MLLSKEFTFDAAHNLIHYHGKCEKLHGHTYRLKVVIEGQPGSEGMIIDFLEVSKIVKDNVISILDHSYLNEIIPQPSAENIALWIWEKLKDKFNLSEIHVWETSNSCVILRKSDFERKD